MTLKVKQAIDNLSFFNTDCIVFPGHYPRVTVEKQLRLHCKTIRTLLMEEVRKAKRESDKPR